MQAETLWENLPWQLNVIIDGKNTLIESNEEFVLEPRPKNAGIAFGEHLVTALSEADFKDESLEREAADEPALEFCLRLDSDTDDEACSPVPPENGKSKLVAFDEHPVTISPEAGFTLKSDKKFVLESQPEIAGIEFDEHLVTALSEADFMDESLERETNNEPNLEFCLRLDSEDDEEEERIRPYKERFSPENAGIGLVTFDEHPVSISTKAGLTGESDEEFVSEPRPEIAGGIEFDEHLVNVSSEAVFMDDSLERRTTNETSLQFHLRLDSEDDEDEEGIFPYKERFSPARVLKLNEQKPNEIILVPDANEFDRKLQSSAIVVLERCSIPSSSRAEIVLAKEREEQSTETEPERIIRIGQVSTNSLKAKLRRAKETADIKRKARVATRAEYMREKIANETGKERKSRVAADAERHSKKKVKETPEQRKARLACLSDCLRETRANDAIDQRKFRRLYNVEYMIHRKEHETDEQSKARAASRAEKHRKKRANETAEQRTARRAADAEAQRKRRANETAEQTKARLAAKCEGKRKKRANETAEQKKARLAYEAEYIKHRKANETAEQRKVRLATNAALMRRRIANETAEQRKKRFAANAEYMRRKIANETAEQRKIRLAYNAAKSKKYKAKVSSEVNRKRQNRTSETAEQREEHRAASHVERTRQERSEEREKRLSRANTMP